MKLQKQTLEKIRELINEETQYRSGATLVSFFNDLWFKDNYWQWFPSRWMYTDDRLEEINWTPKIKECIQNVLSPINFIWKLNELDEFILELNQYLNFDWYKIVRKDKIINIIESSEEIDNIYNNWALNSEEDFLKQDFKEVSINKLKLDSIITEILEQRLEEIKKCLLWKTPLSTIFLCGSTLEWIMLGIASQNMQKYNSANASPKDKTWKVLTFDKWTLSSYIDVSKELWYLDENVKKFSHTLREFRNYIHPHQQSIQGFTPDEHTAKLCRQVLKLAIFQFSQKV